MRGELQAGLNRGSYDRQQTFLGNEEYAAILGIADGVNVTYAPRSEHVGAAGEHPAIEIGFDADNAQEIILFFEERTGRDAPNIRLNVLKGAERIDMLRHRQAQRQSALRPQ